MLIHDVAGATAMPRAVQVTTTATSAILAEAKAGYRAALASADDGWDGAATAPLLATRLARLEAAAGHAVAAANEGMLPSCASGYAASMR